MSTGNGDSRRGAEAQRIALPGTTAARLEEWLRTKAQIEGLIDSTLMAAREALGVPNDWQIRNVQEGFVAPAASNGKVDPEANGVPEGLREVVG